MPGEGRSTVESTPCSHEAQGWSVDPGMPGQPREVVTEGAVSSADFVGVGVGLKESLRRPPTREVGTQALALGTLAQSQTGGFAHGSETVTSSPTAITGRVWTGTQSRAICQRGDLIAFRDIHPVPDGWW